DTHNFRVADMERSNRLLNLRHHVEHAEPPTDPLGGEFGLFEILQAHGDEVATAGLRWSRSAKPRDPEGDIGVFLGMVGVVDVGPRIGVEGQMQSAGALTEVAIFTFGHWAGWEPFRHWRK